MHYKLHLDEAAIGNPAVIADILKVVFIIAFFDEVDIIVFADVVEKFIHILTRVVIRNHRIAYVGMWKLSVMEFIEVGSGRTRDTEGASFSGGLTIGRWRWRAIRAGYNVIYVTYHLRLLGLNVTLSVQFLFDVARLGIRELYDGIYVVTALGTLGSEKSLCIFKATEHKRYEKGAHFVRICRRQSARHNVIFKNKVQCIELMMNRGALIGVAGIRDAVLRDEDVIFEIPIAEHYCVALRADRRLIDINALEFVKYGRTFAIRA